MILTLIAGTALAVQGAQAAVRIPNLPAPPKADQVLARVNGVTIKADDIAALLWEVRGEEILNDYVAYHLIKAQAEKAGVLVSDADVQRQIADILKQQSSEIAPGADPQAALSAQGFTAARLFLNVKTDLLISGLAAVAFRPADYVKVSTIIVVPKTQSPADVALATESIVKAAARIKAGETWEKVASETIEDASAKNTGGYLGWRPLDSFPAALRGEIAAMAPGGISGVSATNYGVQMFRVEAQGKDVKGAALEELRTTVLGYLREKTLQDARAAGKIEILSGAKPKG